MLASRPVLLFALVLLAIIGLAYLVTWQRYRKGETKNRTPGLDRRYHLDVAAVGILLALVGGFFWRPLFNTDVTIPGGGGDLASFFFPMHQFAAERLWAGEFPLWNPHLFAGMPFAADIQSGLFYPVNWLFWLLGYPVTYAKLEMLVLAHYWMAASFTYALARSLGMGRASGLLAGILYSFSGFAVGHLGHLTMLESATWLPLALLFVCQATRLPVERHTHWAQKTGWAVALGLTLALSLLAGHFQLFLFTFYASLVFWLVLAWRYRPQPIQVAASGGTDRPPTSTTQPASRYWMAQVSRMAMAATVFVGASLVQTWPFYELGQLSVRSAISYETSSQLGVWPIGFLEFLLPNVFSPDPQAYFGYWSNTEVLGYMALLTYPLAAFSLLIGPPGRSRFYPALFIGLGFAGLLFALSDYTIFHGWLYQFVPALNLTRGFGRLLVLFNLGLAVAAAFGLQRLLDARIQAQADTRDNAVISKTARIVGWVGVGLIALPLALLYTQVLSSPGSINDLVVRGIDGIVMAALILGLIVIILRLSLQGALRSHKLALCVIALVVFDLFSARSQFNIEPGDATRHFSHSETAAFIKQSDPTGQYRIDESSGTAQDVWQPDTALLMGLYDVRGLANPLQLADYETLWNAITGSQQDFRNVPAYDLLGARSVIVRKKEDPTGEQFKQVYQDTRPGINLTLFENSRALPLAWVVHRTEVKTHQDALPLLVSSDFKPSEIAYLEGGRALGGAAGSQDGESVRLVRRSANHVQLEADVKAEGYVVISQAYYPGWRVRLDDAEAELVKANYAFGAVYVPPGRHTITLNFAPQSVAIGGIISLLTWLAALGYLASRLFLAIRSYRSQPRR